MGRRRRRKEVKWETLASELPRLPSVFEQSNPVFDDWYLQRQHVSNHFQLPLRPSRAKKLGAWRRLCYRLVSDERKRREALIRRTIQASQPAD